MNMSKEVWNEFEIKTTRDYLNIYLESNVLLLTDVYEQFRKMCLQKMCLLFHYFSSPWSSWDAMFKKKNVELEFMKDVELDQFIGIVVRDGVSNIAQVYSKGNNKDVTFYDKNESLICITYLEKNKMYG